MKVRPIIFAAESVRATLDAAEAEVAALRAEADRLREDRNRLLAEAIRAEAALFDRNHRKVEGHIRCIIAALALIAELEGGEG